MTAEVKWGLFRGRLRAALRDADPELAEIEQNKLTPQDVERLTGGQIQAAVLTAYLDKTRDDLPIDSLSLLCGVPELALSTSDYLGSPPFGIAPSPPVHNYPAIEVDAARRKWNTLSKPDRHLSYITLDCADPEEMRKAFRTRLQRAGITVLALGRDLGMSAKPIENFLYLLNHNNTGPWFAAKLQERFWEVCAFLNKRIHSREKADDPHMPSTEQFVLELLKEGTASSPVYIAEKLHALNEFALEQTISRRS